MHSLLKRQLKRFLGDKAAIPAEWDGFVEAVDQAYQQFDADRAMLERSLDLSSRELLDAHSDMRSLFECIINSSKDGILAFDLDRRTMAWNPGMESLTGLSQSAVLGKGVAELWPLMLGNGADRIFQAVLEGESTTLAGQFAPKPAGADVAGYFEGYFSPLRNANGRVIGGLAVIRDVTERVDAELERRRAQESLVHQAYHDALTDLPNRKQLMDYLVQMLGRIEWQQRLVAVMYLDLDHFQRINDTLGHSIGDAFIKVVAGMLMESLRDGDVVARLGGDEFVMVLDDVARVQDVSHIAQKILNLFVRPLNVEGHEVFVTASIGISVSPTDGADGETLLRNADTALYRAKGQGRNTFQFFLPEMNAEVSKRLTLETALRHALERDEFLLHYQPLIDIATGRPIGVEGLVRWQHPEWGLVPPLQFIPLAEETGLIIPIGEWVLRSACRQGRRWHEAGYRDFRVAVNLSARQFHIPTLLEDIRRALADTGFDPRCLELELTESILQNADKTLETLKALAAMGVEISIDDFGTGYSSLSYLRRFPIHKLKIDRAFVRDIARHGDDRAIVEAIVTLAKTLRYKVIAEGVERPEQLDYLRGLGCDEFQGYLFSPPVPAERIAGLLGAVPAPAVMTAKAR